MSNVKICWKGRISEGFLLEFWEERGEKLITCHLFLDNFSRNFVTFGLFSKVKSFWNKVFVFKILEYHNSEIMNFVFLNLVFRKRRVIAEIWLCFRACNSPIVTYDQEFCLVVWLCVLITVTESFEKVSLKKSWCCQKCVLVFEIVSLKGLNKLWSNHSFPIECWVEDLFTIMEKVWKTFPFWGVDF